MKTKLQEALAGIMRRSDEIVAMAEANENDLAKLFSLKENNATIETCLALADAVAGTTMEEIAAEREQIEDCREHVTAANAAISRRATRNPLMMNAVETCEDIIFDFLLAGDANVIWSAKMARRLKWAVRKMLNCGFSDLGQQLAKHGDASPLKVEIVKAEKTKKEVKTHPRQTPFMREQRRVFREFLDRNPVCASYSLIKRARQCWHKHRTEWKKLAETIGYASYKSLAQGAF